ncbi:amino acid adenylation domain-containing protein [Marilutibacter chinensis]|uniref:Amino acid adenylation domain-containing protein n=1 Tax=Marilutibacter chinensis TaxID=2912247 RepID=A0ABS9HRQ1_9GAMM|nr:amino acid adenylation domain-containing protein [Lysobacter chinensis]MCF7221619.1 amino acid adenylation domain-containing protein [Lysobacter chinensis]
MNESSRVSLPLTVAQRGLWVGQKIASADATLNIAEAIEISGPIDPVQFRRALHQVVREAETLRVQVIEEEGKPRQIVRPAHDGPSDDELLHDDTFPFIDVSAETDPRAAAEAWMRAELVRPVDLARDPLWVAALFKAAEDRYFWYQRAHHVVYDGYSGGMVVRRVAQLYSAYVAGREPEPCGFGSLAALVEAEAAYRESKRFQRDREYWLEQLAELPEAVTLARGVRSNEGGLRHSIGYLPIAQARQLDELGRRHSASLPQVMIALIAAYFHRATGADDLVFGMPVSGRVGAALRASPGMVANAVTIRLSFTPESTAAGLFAQVSKVVKQALRHQQYRYEDLRRDLGLIGQDRHIARLGVNIEPFDYQLDFGGAGATSHNLSNGSQEDLTVFVFDRGNDSDPCIYFDASPSLYPMAELDEHRRRLMRLIDAVLADPGQPLDRIDILGDAERRRLLIDFNDTAAPLEETSLPQRVGRRAATTPEAVAVVSGDAVLTYRELHERSVRQARRLIAEGVGPGDIVAVALPRGEQLLIALLAIMRSGAAYLPIDPDGPAERAAMMLEDAEPVAMIALPERHPRHAGGGLLLLSPEEDGRVADLPKEPDLSSPEATAYVLYTSGSTGRPKGVEVTHRNLGNFLQGMQAVLEPERSDRFLALTTVSFDIAALELFLPLVTGARVVIAGAGVAHDPPRLARLIGERGITHVQATPSLWRVLLASREARLDGVHALVGGEALGAALAAELKRRAARVTQFYGPTETTVWSTAFDLDEAATPDGAGAHAPPIGRPILNTRLYVLDGNRQPVVTGAIGELYIGGAGVAKGYLRRPQLNAERFLDDPFAADGSRMYRTGDRVRWLEGGVLEFIGRVDDQVKIRGHRVELAEIEHQLLACTAVAAAAVAAHRDAENGTALAAYLVPVGDDRPDFAAVRGELARRLPEAMIPSSFMWLERLPLTSSGKLDRKALPVPEHRSRAPYTEPATALEKKLAALWREVLRLERVGVHDNFFELGGDSLSAAEMIARFPEYLSMELPLASVFEASTIAGLAASLQSADSRDAAGSDPLAALLPLRATGGERQRPLFCIHPVVGLGWAYTALLRHLDPGLPVYGLQARGLRGDGALPASVEEIAADCIERMRTVQPKGPYRLLGWSLGGLIGHGIAARLQASGEQVELLAMMDAYPFSPEREHTDRDPSTEAGEVRAALRFLGFHRKTGDHPPATMDALADWLCREYDVLSLPLVQEIMKREPRLIEHVAMVTRNHLRLARRYVPGRSAPGRIRSDLLFFRAARQASVDLEGLMHYHPTAWHSHFDGEVTLDEIDSDHQSMLEPAAAAQIGRILQERLDGLRRSDDPTSVRTPAASGLRPAAAAAETLLTIGG